MIKIKNSLSPDKVYVAGNFITDGIDLLNRYELCLDHYCSVKSRRFKCFVDLRIACECILKSIIAYNCEEKEIRKNVIKKTELHGHNILKLTNILKQEIPEEIWKELHPFAEQTVRLPIGLRYSLDAFDYLEENEKLYYETIGSDLWMESFHSVLCKLGDEISVNISKHDGIINASDLLSEFLSPKYNKYKKT